MSAPILHGGCALTSPSSRPAPSAVRAMPRAPHRRSQGADAAAEYRPEGERRFVERDHSRGRQRHAPVSDHARRLQAARPDLQQADDLLPAGDADAGGHPGHPDHHHAGGSGQLRAPARRRRATSACGSPTPCSRAPTASRRRSSSAGSSSAATASRWRSATTSSSATASPTCCAPPASATTGATVFGYLGPRSGTLRRRRIRRRGPGGQPRGEAGAAAARPTR